MEWAVHPGHPAEQPAGNLTGQHSGDYIRGYRQAQRDFRERQTFQSFPVILVRAVTLFSRAKADELAAFMRGYHAYERDLMGPTT